MPYAEILSSHTQYPHPSSSTTDPNTLSFPKEANGEQRMIYAALMAFLRANNDIFDAEDAQFRILSGYAGTGKTWLLVQWVLEAAKSHRVALCAPTHKAVSVISAKLAEQAEQDASYKTLVSDIVLCTVHSLLGLRLREDSDGGMTLRIDRQDKRDYFEQFDLVVIDESSMLSPQLLKYIQDYQHEGRRPKVLFVGDPGQLLPVDDEVTDFDSNVISLIDTARRKLAAPVFNIVETQHTLTEIVRQKSTGRIHPITLLAQEIRQYIEGDVPGIFSPQKVQAFIQHHSESLQKLVVTAPVHTLSQGAVTLRHRFPEKDIRVIAWRNAVVDQHNAFIHRELASHYLKAEETETGNENETEGSLFVDHVSAPFWNGEMIISRAAMIGFAPFTTAYNRAPKFWEEALSPDIGATEKKAPAEGILRIPNNAEMCVKSCILMHHPYLDIPSWWVTATLSGNQVVEFFVANDSNQHSLLQQNAWSEYRRRQRTHSGSKRAWAITRACAPVMHGYALTAHKSQGSTFHFAIVDLKDLYGIARKSGPDDYHRALYVAVTRASERVWLGI